MNSKQEALVFLHSNLQFLFEGELKPTLANAQNLVLKPTEINLEEWINHEFLGDWKIEDYFSDDEDLDCITEKSFDEMIKPTNYKNDAFYISGGKNNTELDDVPIINLSIQSDEIKKSPGITPLKKKTKKYSIKKDVDLPTGITLQHALSSSVQGNKETAPGANDAAILNLDLRPLTRETSDENSTHKKKERRKRRPKPKEVSES
jgi:hypothetical protein